MPAEPLQANPRLKVCLLVDTVAFQAGTERQVIETAKRLNRNVFEVHVCCLENSPQLESLREYCHTRVFSTVRLTSMQGVRELVELRRYLDFHQIRVVHAFMNKTAIAGVLSSAGRKRAVVTSRLNTGYWYTPAWKLVFRGLNAGTTCVLANSESARRIAIDVEKLPESKVRVIYQGVDLERFHPLAGDASACLRIGIPMTAPVIGIVSNLRPVKDLPLFLRAARLVSQAAPEVAFLIIGSGEQLGELRQLAVDLGLERVFFTAGQGQVVDYLARLRIGCLTSQSEGFSNAILEYMAMGLPVVATEVGGNSEAIVDGETGYLVRERTPEAFAAPLISLLADESRRRAMGTKGLQRCASLFSWDRTILDLERFYLDLAGCGELPRPQNPHRLDRGVCELPTSGWQR